MLTVWGNAEFGCEFAYIAAKKTGYRVLLVDLDLLCPSIDLYLNIRKTPEGVTSEGIFSDSGVNIVMDSIGKGFITGDILTEASVKRRELSNLFILTGNYVIENYEYYKDESLIKFIDKCYQCFDITVLLVNKSIYDSYTIISLAKSDYNIIAIRAEVDKIREFNTYLRFLNESQRIHLEKSRFVAYEYQTDINLAENILGEITSNYYIGKVGHSKKRAKYRNLSIPYASRMEKEVLKDYFNLMRRFNILPIPSLLDRIKGLGRRTRKEKGWYSAGSKHSS